MDARPKKNLLIIDDHPVYRDALSEKLGLEFAADGIDVAVASSANARRVLRWPGATAKPS